jgi:hypothetical protein
MQKSTVAAALAAALFASAAPAAEVTLEVTVAAGDRDRPAGPVCVALTDAPAGRTVVIKGPDGREFPGQITGPSLHAAAGTKAELCFVAPAMKAGAKSVFVAAVSDGPASGDAFAWKDTPGEHADLSFAGRPVLRYMYKALDDGSKEAREKTYKPYHHLFSPDGKTLLTKGPGGQFTHHRGIYYGFNRVTYGEGKKADVWHCTGDAHQSHEKFVSSEAGPVLGRHVVEIGWRGVGKELFAREHRELTVYAVPGGHLVEFASRLEPVVSPVRLDGDPQHAGFQFRADNEVSAVTKKQTYYLRPDGPGKPGETRNWDPKSKKGPTNLAWNAMSFVLGGQRYTVAYLDKPTNPKEARFSERDYGRFGSYFEYDLTAEKPLRLNYRLWVIAGEAAGADVEAHSAAFTAPATTTLARRE